MIRLIPLAIAAILATPAAGIADSLDDSLEAAMSAESRSDDDKARDANRLPIQTLQFFGLESDMRVIEMIPGGGWYTRLLAPTLAEDGELMVAVGTGRVADGLLKEPGFDKVKVLDTGAEITPTDQRGVNDISEFDFGVSDVDMVLTFRNWHNFSETARHRMNKAAFDALESGGIFGVVDHTRRHNEPDNSENRRRLDPVRVIKEVEDCGFEFVGFSDLHYRPSDQLSLEVGTEGVSGQTDRFTLKFRKP